jgi:hypothetical protein
MHPASYVFGSAGVINQTSLDPDNVQPWNTGLAFLFGLLSVQWTVSASTFGGTAFNPFNR